MSDETERRATAARRLAKAARGLRSADQHAGVVRAVHALRRMAPGGAAPDESETTGGRASDRLARLITQARPERPSASRELGLTAVQVWQAALESRRGPRGSDAELTLLFTDLVDFSEWALQAGDDHVLRLLGDVGRVSERAVARHDGSVVKSLGDGLMAVFPDTAGAVEAAHEACTAVSAITLDGYRPQLRTGLHRGRPRRVGRDYLGVDVNIAARVADAASAGEVLVSGPALADVDTDRYTVRRRRRFRAKGAPKELDVYSIVPRGGRPG